MNQSVDAETKGNCYGKKKKKPSGETMNCGATLSLDTEL